MRQNILAILVYPLLLINIAIGYLMLTSTHILMLVLVSRFNQEGAFEELGAFYAIQQSASIFSIILIAIIGIIAFPLLERYYSNAIQNQTLMRRFLRVIAIQLVYLGTVQILTHLLASASVTIISVSSFVGGGLLFVLLRHTQSTNMPFAE